MTSGVSVITAKPWNSVFKAMPGPEVIVSAVFPAYEAPSATPMAAISSSAWCTKPPKSSKISERACEAEVAGVIGYIEQISKPAETAPSARAVFPFIATFATSLECASISKHRSKCVIPY